MNNYKVYVLGLRYVISLNNANNYKSNIFNEPNEFVECTKKFGLILSLKEFQSKLNNNQIDMSTNYIFISDKY